MIKNRQQIYKEVDSHIEEHSYGDQQSMYQRYFKRVLDIILSLIALILLSPIILMIAILVRVELGSPVLFKQQRPGLNEEIFTMYKFRTMTNERDENGELLPDELRLTKFGEHLQRTSLDELPELLNILKGDMSVIGPRPLMVKYLPYYTDRERKRHSVRPGLSGLAQINGRNTASWEDRFHYDLSYVEDITLMTDLTIIFKTLKKTIQRADIGPRGLDESLDLDVYRKNLNKGG